MAYDGALGGSKLVLFDSKLKDNQSGYSGAGLYAENHAIVSSTETEWSGNYANYGNGAGLYAENSVEIYSTDYKWKENYSDNWSGYYGGAIFIGHILSAIDSIEDNSALRRRDCFYRNQHHRPAGCTPDGQKCMAERFI